CVGWRGDGQTTRKNTFPLLEGAPFQLQKNRRSVGIGDNLLSFSGSAWGSASVKNGGAPADHQSASGILIQSDSHPWRPLCRDSSENGAGLIVRARQVTSADQKLSSYFAPSE